jgi:predicted outer membrane lipoprotein
MCAETAEDYSLRLLSLEDDPTLPVFTFRMWILGLGLACFGAVLGQLFVRCCELRRRVRG